jgi:hypothetical protein
MLFEHHQGVNCRRARELHARAPSFFQPPSLSFTESLSFLHSSASRPMSGVQQAWIRLAESRADLAQILIGAYDVGTAASKAKTPRRALSRPRVLAAQITSSSQRCVAMSLACTPTGARAGSYCVGKLAARAVDTLCRPITQHMRRDGRDARVSQDASWVGEIRARGANSADV